jgi:hypothetical protein
MADAAVELARLADEHPTQTLETPMTATAPLAAAGSVPSAPVDPEPTPGTESTPVVAAPPAAPSAERSRRRTPVLVVALLLLLLGGAVAVALLPGEDEEPAAAPDGASSTAPQDPRGSGTSDPSEEPPAEPSEEGRDAEPSQEGATTAPAAEAGSGEAEALVSEYYGLLPDDTRTAWGYLGGEARSDAGGYGGYTGFWETVESVSVEGTSVEDGVVTVDLVYDGAESETRRLVVAEQGGGLVIADDLGAA